MLGGEEIQTLSVVQLLHEAGHTQTLSVVQLVQAPTAEPRRRAQVL